MANSAVPDQAWSDRAAGRVARRCVRSDARAQGGRAGRDQEIPGSARCNAALERGDVHATRRDRRRQLGRRRIQS